MGYRVKAAAAVVKIGGTERYLYQGAIVPEGATNAEHLEAIGLIEAFDVPATEPEDTDPEGTDATPPPKDGPGSGKAAWHTYAAAVGVEVPADASRDDVIAAIEAAGKPTE